MEHLKAALKAIKLMEFPGENITNLCFNIRYYCNRLENSGYCDEQLLVKLYTVFKAFIEEQFSI